MGFSSKGKQGSNQEKDQLALNNKNSEADRALRQRALDQMQSQIALGNNDISALEAEPGFRAQDLTDMRTERANMNDALYGDLAERIARHNAQSGHANDAGFASQMADAQNQRARMNALGGASINEANAREALTTRRAVPGMRFAPVGAYAGVANSAGSTAQGYSSNNAQLVGDQLRFDAQMSPWQQMMMAGIGAAGQAFQGKCWIAQAIFGKWNRRTRLLRRWLHEVYANSGLVARATMWAYGKFGQRVARSRFLVRALTPLFNRALVRAQQHYAMEVC